MQDVPDPTSHLVDLDAVPVVEVWGDTVTARAIDGERVTLALVDLAPDAVVPEHRHENEQMGICITGSITFTVDSETRALGPGGTWRIPSDRPHHAVAGPNGALVVDIFAPARTDWDSLPHVAPRPIDWHRD
jgi:quercetin dioxygenase-like cupin family protein